MKKIIFALLCYLFLNVGSVHALNETGINPRALVVSCGECGALIIASPISTRTVSTTATCIHGKSGDDSVRNVYTQYEVSCSACNYYDEFERKTSTTVIKCLGK